MLKATLIAATEPDLLLGHDQQPTAQAKAAMVIPHPKRLNVATSTPPLPGQAAAQATLVVVADDNAHHLAVGVASRRHGEALICQHVRTAQLPDATVLSLRAGTSVAEPSRQHAWRHADHLDLRGRQSGGTRSRSRAERRFPCARTLRCVTRALGSAQ
jgi:hypothetical protein